MIELRDTTLLLTGGSANNEMQFNRKLYSLKLTPPVCVTFEVMRTLVALKYQRVAAAMLDDEAALQECFALTNGVLLEIDQFFNSSLVREEKSSTPLSFRKLVKLYTISYYQRFPIKTHRRWYTCNNEPTLLQSTNRKRKRRANTIQCILSHFYQRPISRFFV